jgi:hypothetical protein
MPPDHSGLAAFLCISKRETSTRDNMHIESLSTTLVNNYPQCPSRAIESHKKRVEHGDDQEGTDATRFGTVVHNTMEQIHADLIEGINNSNDNILWWFDEFWRQSAATEFDEYYRLGRERIVDFVRRSILDRDGDTVAVELDFVYDLVNDQVYLVTGCSLKLAGRYIEVKARKDAYALIQEAKGVPVSSKIDRVDFVNFDGGGVWQVQIFDYKTNRMMFTRDEVDNSKQLGLYYMVARSLWPEAKSIECVFDMLRHGRYRADFDPLFFDDLRAYLIATFQQINSKEDFEERINKYCSYCDRRSQCQQYQNLVTNTDTKFLPILTEESSVQDMYDLYNGLSFIYKTLDARIEEIKTAFKAKMVAEDRASLPLEEGKELYLAPNPRYEYDIDKVWNLLSESGSLTILKQAMNLSKTSFEKALKNYPALQEAVKPFLQQNFVQPSLKARKIKKETE